MTSRSTKGRTIPAAQDAFFRDLPETRLLFDLDRMIRDGETFDYGSIAPEMVEKSWVPSYCKSF